MEFTKKTMKLKTTILLSCFILVLMTSSSFSQPPGMGMKKWRGEGPCWSASELNLSPEQKKSLALIQQAYFREAQLIRTQLFTKRLELRELLIHPTIRIESIRVKYLEIIDLQSKQEEQAIEYLIKLRNLLTLEQLRSWCPEQEFPIFRQMMQGRGPMGPKRFREE